MRAKHAKSGHPYLYLVLLIVSCILIIGGYFVYNAINPDEDPDDEPIPTTTTTITTTTTAAPTTTTTGSSETNDATTTTVTTTTTTKAPTTTTKKTGTDTTSSSEKVSFPDTLFIGDSRTHGLSLYGKISDADFFAGTSFSSFSILKDTTKVEIDGVGKVSLTQLLQKKQYKTVYIALGINEIGYAMSNIVGKYETLIATVQQYQPDAVIMLQSTIHVRADKQQSSKGITNANINTLNSHLKAMADGTRVLYLDVNTVFDDENGAMDPKYSNDGVHFYSKYYYLWRDFLAANHPQ